MSDILRFEDWVDVRGYEGFYQVSNIGRVKSLTRIVSINGGSFTRKGVVLKPMVNRGGYAVVNLYRNGVRRYSTVHRLVAYAFLNIPDLKSKIVVNHINGDKIDNRLSNLEFVTNRDNCTTCFRSDRDRLTSNHVGVWLEGETSLWRSAIFYRGRQYKLGSFGDELSASDAYQSALVDIKSNTFNHSDYIKPNTSIYKGVHFKTESQKWVAQIYVKRKPIYLGSFPTELEAHNAYQNALKDIITQTTLANSK